LADLGETRPFEVPREFQDGPQAGPGGSDSKSIQRIFAIIARIQPACTRLPLANRRPQFLPIRVSYAVPQSTWILPAYCNFIKISVLCEIMFGIRRALLLGQEAQLRSSEKLPETISQVEGRDYHGNR
jgi:hypothetical protein